MQRVISTKCNNIGKQVLLGHEHMADAALRCDMPFADFVDRSWSVLNVTGRALLPSLIATVSLDVSSKAGTKLVALAMDWAHRAGRSSKLGMVSLALLVVLCGIEKPIDRLCSGGEGLRGDAAVTVPATR